MDKDKKDKGNEDAAGPADVPAQRQEDDAGDDGEPSTSTSDTEILDSDD